MSALEDTLLFQLRALGVPEPEREMMLVPGRRFRTDFCWPAQRLAVEVEGGVYAGGRHTRGKGFEADCVKYNALALAGWKLLRYPASMVYSGEAAAEIEAELRKGERC